VLLHQSGYECYVSKTFIKCIMYADDLILISHIVSGLKALINICSNFGVSYDTVFNPNKTVSMYISNSVYCSPIHSLHMGGSPIAWVNRLKYLDIYFVNKKSLCVDVSEVKQKFYASCNSVFCRSKYACEIVKVTLIRCLPLLTYYIGSSHLTAKAIRQFGVCWNDAFHKVFNYIRMESVKLLQYFFLV